LRREILILGAVSLACATSGAASAQPADIVVVNAKVFTARDGADIVQGFAIRANDSSPSAASAEMRAHIGSGTPL
jgi:hypothetical protein